MFLLFLLHLMQYSYEIGKSFTDALETLSAYVFVDIYRCCVCLCKSLGRIYGCNNFHYPLNDVDCPDEVDALSV